MIERKEDDWTVFYDDDGKREIIRIQFPKDMTDYDLFCFIEHLKRQLNRINMVQVKYF